MNKRYSSRMMTIAQAAVFGARIVCLSLESAEEIFRLAQEMGVTIEYPLVTDGLTQGDIRRA